MGISKSKRLNRVHRVFDPYLERNHYVRLDRNEDPVGWEDSYFNKVMRSITPHDIAAYADSTDFTKELSKWVGVEPHNIYVTSGSDAAVKNIFETYIDQGDNIILQKPSWRMYEVYADIYGANKILIEYDNRLQLDTRHILDALTKKKIKLVLLANPNQPIGTELAREKILEIIHAASKTDTLVVVDEAYYLFSTQTFVDQISRYANLVIVRTFSKAFGLASLRLGYCVGAQERIDELMLLRPVTDSNGLALKIGEYALANIDWILTRVKDFNEGRDYLYLQLEKKGAKTFKTSTNFIHINCNTRQNALDVIAKVRQKNYLIKGPYTEPPLENCIRITTGPKKLMEKFWNDCNEILIS